MKREKWKEIVFKWSAVCTKGIFERLKFKRMKMWGKIWSSKWTQIFFDFSRTKRVFMFQIQLQRHLARSPHPLFQWNQDKKEEEWIINEISIMCHKVEKKGNCKSANTSYSLVTHLSITAKYTFIKFIYRLVSLLPFPSYTNETMLYNKHFVMMIWKRAIWIY